MGSAAAAADERLPALAADWVIAKQRGRAQVFSWAAWQRAYRDKVMANAPRREKYLLLSNAVFGGAALLDWRLGDDSPPLQPQLVCMLQEIYPELSAKLWGVPEDDLCRSMKEFPDEARRACAFEDFVHQYVRMREWLWGVARSHVGREFRTLVRVRLEVVSATDAASGATMVQAVGCKRGSATGDGAKRAAAGATDSTRASHWASPKVLREATDHTFLPSMGGE